jgi:hypothetical protein
MALGEALQVLPGLFLLVAPRGAAGPQPDGNRSYFESVDDTPRNGKSPIAS